MTAAFRAPDGATYGRPPKPVPPDRWICHPDDIHCRYGHDHVRVRETSSQVRIRADGHIYLACPECAQLREGHSYAFGVSSTRPDLIVSFYAVRDRAQYEQLLAFPDDAATWDLLHFLGYVPDRRHRPR